MQAKHSSEQSFILSVPLEDNIFREGKHKLLEAEWSDLLNTCLIQFL